MPGFADCLDCEFADRPERCINLARGYPAGCTLARTHPAGRAAIRAGTLGRCDPPGSERVNPRPTASDATTGPLDPVSGDERLNTPIDPVWVGVDLCPWRSGCQCAGSWGCTRHDIVVMSNYVACQTCLTRDGKIRPC